jgi:hypothetical protein
MDNIDFDALSAELVRALRGRRSQAAFSRWLGFRSNVVHSWETRKAWPTAALFFRVAERCGRDLPKLSGDFLPVRSEGARQLTTREGVAAFLEELRGRLPVIELARLTGRSRFAVARWLQGFTEPRLPDFLRVVEAASLRVVDLAAGVVDAAHLPSLRARLRAMNAAREAAFDVPWSQAVLRATELELYRSSAKHEPGLIARLLGITLEEEQRCLDLLVATGQLSFAQERYIAGAPLAVDTRVSGLRSRDLKVWWSRISLGRLQAGAEGLYFFNLFAVSQKDLERLEELQRGYFRELRRIVAESEPSECVVLVNWHLLPLAKRTSLER